MNINEMTARLKAVAQKAGAGEWCAFIDTKSKTYSVHTPDDNRCGDVVKWAGFDGQKQAAAKARYIATANPANILALTEALEAAEELNKHLDLAVRKAEGVSERLRVRAEDFEATMIAATDRAQAAEARIAELEARERHTERQSVIDGLAASGETREEIQEYMKSWDAARAPGIKLQIEGEE